jgi:hypothetical protein
MRQEKNASAFFDLSNLISDETGKEPSCSSTRILENKTPCRMPVYPISFLMTIRSSSLPKYASWYDSCTNAAFR